MSINYLSPLVEKQLPGFVREENPNFVTFLEKYYEWMETSGKPIYENYNLLNAKDIDLANDFFIKQIKEELLPSFPEEILLDDVKFLKTINQFYRSKGTPDSIKFLFKILYNEDIDIYFPSNEILKLSDGKWVLPLALRVETNDPNVFNLVKTQVRGTTSDATAVVEKVVSSVDRALGIQYIELFVSNVNRLFTTGETLTSSYIDGDDTITVTAKLIGSLSEVKIDPKNRGLFYKDNDPRGLFYYPEDIEIQYGGDPVTFVGGLNPDENANPKPAEAVVGEVLKGQINEIITIDGGFGFRRSIYPNTSIIDFKGGFASGRLGQESKAEIILVDEKTYRTINVGNSEIQSFYSNTINSIDNVSNNKTINEITTKQSLNLHPIAFLSAVSSGGGYSSRPDIETYSLYNESLDDELVISSAFVTRKTNVIRDSTQDLTQSLEKGDIIRLFVKNRFEQVETVQEVTSNTITIGSSFETNINNLQVYKVLRRNLVQLGSLGRIKILNGGSNYNVGNYLIFTANGRGYGANAQVTQVHAGNNGIKAVEFNESSAYVRGGEGYTSAEFPIITVDSANGSNAQLVVSEILGDGEKVEISTSRIGAVSKIKVISYGYDYTSAPIVSLRNADLYLSNVTQGLLFTSNSKVYQGTSNTSTTFEAYFDKYVSGNSHIRIFNYIGTFDDTKQLKSFDNTISADIFDYVFFGNGKAKATAKFENGLIRYPGIYLNEDGQPSSEKRFQDSNKYHNFSYVINTENDYKKFSKTLSDVLHPTGTKSFVTRIKKFENDVASLVITSNNFITTPLSNTFNVFVGTGIAVVTGSGANVNLASSISVGDTIVFRNLLKTLNGTVSYVSGSNTITGNGTNFINDIYDGQVIKLVSGNSEVVAYVTNANSIITQNTLTSTVTDGTISLYYDEVDTVTFVNANTIFVSTIFPSSGSFVSANLKIDLGAASSLRDINISTVIPSINAYAGEANNFTPVIASGGIGGIAGYLVSPVLPDGLVMISSNGNIRGTPTVIRAPITYTVTAYDRRSRGANATFTLGVTPQPLVALRSIASRTISANTTATAFKPIIPSGGYGSVRYSISPTLSAGVTFDPFTGEIGGIPSVLRAANTYTISMVDDVSQNASNTFVLTVNALPVITSTIIASKSLTANIINAFTPITATGGYGGLTYNIAPTLPTGLSFNTANGYISGNTETILIANTFTITANDGTGQSTSNTFTLTISLPVPITTSQIIDTRTLTANITNAFTPVTATGGYGNLTYSISPSLPTGLTLNTSNGYIYGVTSVLSSNTNYTISLVDEYVPVQTSSNTFFMNVAPPALTSTMGLVTRNLVTGIANSFNTLTASGGYGQITYGISPSLPSGLSLNTSNGFISGTATANTSLTTYTVTANDQASQTTSNTFTMKVYTQLLTRSLIASRTLNTNVANSFLPVIAVSPSTSGDTANAYYFDGANSGFLIRGWNTSYRIFESDASKNFTVEFWIKANSASQTANAYIIQTDFNLRNQLEISVGASITGGAGRISFSPMATKNDGSASGLKIIATGNYLDDTWHHVACVRNNNTGYIYVDGVLVANSAPNAWDAPDYYFVASGYYVGRGGHNGVYSEFELQTDNLFAGYLSNFRISNTAVYTTAFTPSTTQLTRTVNTAILFNQTTIVNNGSASFTAIDAKTVLPTVSTDLTVFSTPAVNLTSGITYSISPTLPTGLTFNTANGFITGNTAQTVVANTYTVTVSDESGQTNSNTFIMNVASAMSMSTGTTLKYNYIGQDPNFTPATASGGATPYTYSIDGLGGNTIPSGTSLNTSNGKISGTSIAKPGVAASFYPYSSTIKVVATDSVGQQISSANIVFELPGAQIPTSFTSRAVRSIIANSTYASINIGVVTGGLGNLNAYLVPASIGESNAALYPLAFSNNVPGMTYSFVPASNTVFISGTPTKAMGVQYDESDNFLGVISDPSREYQIYTQSFDETRITTKGWNSGPFNLNIQASKFYANATTPTLTFSYGVANTFRPITVSGGYGINGNITFAISGNTLPDGLTFITSNGAITGSTLTLYTSNTFTITANDDSFQSASNTFTLQVTTVPFYANTTTASLTFETNSANTFRPITVSGGYGNKTYALSGNTLPAGLTFITSNGAITGSPTNLYGANTFTVTANDDSFQSASNTFTLQVVAKTLSLNKARNVTYTNFVNANGSYKTLFTANGGAGNITFTVTGANTLPSGTFLYSSTTLINDNPNPNSGGVRVSDRYVYLGGVPEGINVSTITVTANDDTGQTSSNSTIITIQNPSFYLAAANALQSIQGREGTQSLQFAPNTSIYTELIVSPKSAALGAAYGNVAFILTGNTLPDGLTFSTADYPANNEYIAAYISGNVNSTYSVNTYTLLTTSNTGSVYANADPIIFDIAVYDTQSSMNVMSFNEPSVSGFNLQTSGPNTTYDSLVDAQGIQLPNTAQLDFGTNPFTIEFWYNGFSGDSIQYSKIFGYNYSLDENFEGPDTTLELSISSDNISISYPNYFSYDVSVSIMDGRWHHVAIVRSSGSILRIFVDGIRISIDTRNVSSKSFSLSDHVIGDWEFYNSSLYQVSNFRITKRELYTTNFTVPTLPLVNVANTVLLLKNSTIVDSSNTPLTLTPYNSNPVVIKGWPNTSITQSLAPSATVTTANAANSITASYSVGVQDSIVVASVSRGYLGIPSQFTITPNLPYSSIIETDVDFKNNQPTRSANIGSGSIIISSLPGGSDTEVVNTSIIPYTLTVTDVLGRQTSNTFTIKINPRLTTNRLISSRNSNINEFTSFLPVQARSTITVTEKAFSNTRPSFNLMSIGGSAFVGPLFGDNPYVDLYVQAYLSEIRLTRRALYTSNFAVPTSKLGAVANTVLLINSDTFTDSSNVALTINTAPRKVNTVIPSQLPTVIVTGNTVHGNVYYFNGVNTAAILPSDAQLDIGTGDFTLEFWANSSSQFIAPYSGTGIFYVHDGQGFYSNVNISLGRASNTSVISTFLNANTALTSNGVSVRDNVWHHIAVVKSGNSAYMFIDGVRRANAIYAFNQGNVLTTGLTYSVTPNLPTGLTITTSNGSIRGTPTVVSNANTYTVTVRDSSYQTASNTFTLQVSVPTLTTYLYSPTNQYTANVTYSEDAILESDGGGGNVTFTLTGNTLPTGLSYGVVDYGGGYRVVTLSGTPTETTALRTYVMTANDDYGQTSSETFTVRVVPPPITLLAPTTYYNYINPNTDVLFETTSGATGGSATISYSISPSLPSGLTFLTSNAAITGNATSVNTKTMYTITASDGISSNATANIELAITDLAPAYAMNFAANTSTAQGIKLPVSSELDLGTGDYTIEFWMKANTELGTAGMDGFGLIKPSYYSSSYTYTQPVIFDADTSSDNGTSLLLANRESMVLRNSTSATNVSTSLVSGYTPLDRRVYSTVSEYDEIDRPVEGKLPEPIWRHIAIVRSSDTTSIYVDGVQQSSVYESGKVATLSGGQIGRTYFDTARFNGLLSNFRITKSALYTAGFIPPTTPLQPVVNTVLLLNGNTITDNSNNNLSLTAFDSFPTVETTFIPSRQPRYHSMGFLSYTFASFTLPSSTQLDFGSGDFTIEFWVRAPNSQSVNAMIVDAGGSSQYTGIGVGTADGGTLNCISFRAQSGYTVLKSTTSLIDPFSVNWHHVACVKSGSNGYLFIDGVLHDSTSSWSGVTAASIKEGIIGKRASTTFGAWFDGNITNFRVTKEALYTSAFGYLYLPLVPVANTVLLLNGNSLENLDTSNNQFTFADDPFSNWPAFYTTPSYNHYPFPDDFAY
jgi:hypothetical protein